MGNSVIDYDSSWEEIYEAARSAPWSATPLDRASYLKRPPLTEADFNRLADIPVLLISDDDLPPHPRHYRQINPLSTQYQTMLEMRVMEVEQIVGSAGEAFNRLGDPEQVRDIADTTSSYAFLSYYYAAHPNSPPIRTAPDAANLSSALPHRLAGELMPASAIVVTNSEFDIRPSLIACAERQLWLPEDDFKVLNDAHELTHLLQLSNERNKKPLLAAALAERDAENGALHLYQTAFGGSKAVAAASIMSHMSYQFELAPQYAFRPGLPVEALDHGCGDVGAIRLCALFTYIGQPPPRFLALQGWGHLQHNNLPNTMRRHFGTELDDISRFAQAYVLNSGVTGMLEDTLLGLKQMSTREFDMIPENMRPLARQLTDAATFTNPALMGFDPIKPRLSYHLLSKTNAATPA